MYKLIFILTFLLSTLIHADTFVSQVFSTEKVNQTDMIIKFANGRVGFISALEKEEGLMWEALSRRKTMRVTLTRQGFIHSAQMLEEKSQYSMKKLSLSLPPPPFQPSVIKNLKEATKIFERLNSNYQRSSECSNRAHVWASEEFSKNNLKSKKVFVLFTASYINRFRFKWWFHVAPLFLINEDGLIESRVFDYMFDHRPKTIKEWTDNFVFSKRHCLLTERFSEYDVNPQTQDCYLMIGTMYDWTPADLSRQETQGYYKTNFSKNELRAAYSEAF